MPVVFFIAYPGCIKNTNPQPAIEPVCTNVCCSNVVVQKLVTEPPKLQYIYILNSK